MPIQFDNEHQLIQWNEAMAHKYDPEAYHLRSHLLIRWIERRRVQAILDFLQAVPVSQVLEVGCGAGNVLQQVPAKHLYGLDLSTFLLRKSQHRLRDYQAKLVQTNAERLPFMVGKFDKLICTEVLEHVTQPQEVLKEMARVATADATLVISIPNETWINRVKKVIQTFGLSRWLLKGNNEAYHSPDQMTDEWHLHSFDLPFLKHVLPDILQIQRVKAIPFRFMPLRYVVQCKITSKSHD